jgi:hypothetical protein
MLYGVLKTIVRILSAKEKASLWSVSVLLDFCNSNYTVLCSIIFTIISFLEKNVYTILVYKVCHARLLLECSTIACSPAHSWVAVPLFAFTCCIQITNAIKRSSSFAPLNHFTLSHVSLSHFVLSLRYIQHSVDWWVCLPHQWAKQLAVQCTSILLFAGAHVFFHRHLALPFHHVTQMQLIVIIRTCTCVYLTFFQRDDCIQTEVCLRVVYWLLKEYVQRTF